MLTFKAPSCSDGVRNGNETDVDCGGGGCPKCNDTRVCNVGSNCVSSVCKSGICQGRLNFASIESPVCVFISAPTCSDGLRNRDETDVDCGGKICPKCIDAKICSDGSDCVSGVCRSRICQGMLTVVLIQLKLGGFSAPTCSDGVRNGDETDVDCGGKTCPKCSNGKECDVAADCSSLQCSSKVCQCKYRCSTSTFLEERLRRLRT